MRSTFHQLVISAIVVACADHADAQCTDTGAIAAEAACKASNNCHSCSDFNFGDDCTSNAREHCAEIECCPECEDEVRAMWACEHGDVCSELSCPAPDELEPSYSFEWAGVFAVSQPTSTWLMQAGTDGTYADESMRLVLFPTDTPDDETMDSLKEQADALIVGDCTVVEDGETMAPAAEGSCFELHVGTGTDSTYSMVTAGLSGIAIYAQHVPTEFERDAHYLYDATGDLEAVAEVGGGSDHAHEAEGTCGSEFDYDNNGVVGVDDLLALLASYGSRVTPCPVSGR